MIKKFKLLRFGMIAFSVYYILRIANSQSLLSIVAQLTLLVLLIVIAEKNIKEYVYEDTITLPLMGLGIVVNVLLGSQVPGGETILAKCSSGLFKSIGGLLVAGLSFYAIGVIGEMIFKRESLGGGDIKLMAGIGSFVGPAVILIIPIWFIVFFIFGMACKVTKGADIVPTAPIHFISLITYLLFQYKIFDIFSVVACLMIIGYSVYVVVSTT